MKRCLAEGRDRFELWVGAAVFANNLMRFAAQLTLASQTKSCLTGAAGPLEPSSKITRRELADAGLYRQLVPNPSQAKTARQSTIL